MNDQFDHNITQLSAPTMLECLDIQAQFHQIYPFEFYSNSALSRYLACPRLYYYEYVLGIEPIGYENWNLKFGSIIHEAAAIYAQGLVERVSPGLCKQAAMTYLMEQDWESSTKIKCYSSAVAFLSAIIKWLDGKTILGSEKMYATPILSKSGNDHIYYVGTIDLTYQLESEQSSPTVIIVDYKTKSRIMNFFYFNSPMNRQFVMYSWLVLGEKVSRDFEVVLLHCVTKPTLIPHMFQIEEHVIKEAVADTQRTIRNIGYNTNDIPSTWVKACTECQGLWGCRYVDLCLRSEKSIQIRKLDGYQIKNNEKRAKEAKYLQGLK